MIVTENTEIVFGLICSEITYENKITDNLVFSTLCLQSAPSEW